MILTPEHSLVHSDIELIKPQVQFLNSIAENENTEELERMRDYCNKLLEKAQLAVYGIVPPSEPQEQASIWEQAEETSQPLPSYTSQATDPYINQDNSIALVC
jgi:hypothetical protein